MEGTTSCFYYTGMRWGQSERTFGVIIPAQGPIAYVCPGFEEDRVREQHQCRRFGNEVRVWQEDESPYAVIAGIVKDRGLDAPPHRHRGARAVLHRRRHPPGGAGLRGRRRHAGHRGLPDDQVKGGDRAVAARERRDARRLQGGAARRCAKGCRRANCADNIMAAFKRLGYPGFVSVQFGKWTALPHGSATPQTLKTATSSWSTTA